MKRWLSRPCENCPFLKESGIRLSAGRIRGIMEHDGVFTCHKHVDYSSVDEDDGSYRYGGEQPCSGWAMLHAKGVPGGLGAQLASRLLFKGNEVETWGGLVFDTLEQAEETAI